VQRTFFLFALALGALCRPAAAADLQIMEPTDKSLVKGTIQFRIKPIDAPTDQFLSNPEVAISTEDGKEVDRFRTPRNQKTGICAAPFDTTKLKDGMYLVIITYRTLHLGRTPMEVREDLTLGLRNGRTVPARAVVELDQQEFKLNETCDLTVKVYDSRGKLMPGARVALKVDRGELDTDAEITDTDGEALVSVSSEDAQTITITVTVESLPPIVKTVKFVE
jgi:hypothetical protein